MTETEVSREADEATFVCGAARLTPEARQELQDFADWLRIPKAERPAATFEEWRTMKQGGPRQPRPGEAEYYCTSCPFAAHLHDERGSGDGSCPVPFGGREWARPHRDKSVSERP